MTLQTGPASLLSLNGIHKSFGGVHALRGASLEVTAKGVGHALIGANGSGKSTLLGVLSGQISPERGTIEIGGAIAKLSTPIAALRYGIAMVAQETAVAPDLTVAENVFLGHRMKRRWWGVDWKSTGRAATEVLGRLGLDIDVHTRVRDLRPDQQQIVEIARTLSMNIDILILDEPTSSLTEDEVASVSKAVQKVKSTGVSVILVTHRFEEVFGLCEEVTVLRDGLTVVQGPLASHDANSLVEAMLGHRETAGPPRGRRRRVGEGALSALEVQDASSPRAFTEVSFSLAAGEIVGLAGLVGSGRSELLESLFGTRSISGKVSVNGAQLTPRSPRQLIDRGVGYVPPDRKNRGVVLSQSVADNLVMVTTLRQSRLHRVRQRQRTEVAASLQRRLGIRCASSHVLVSTLSGGNQQKVSLGKWLAGDARVLMLDEPTRGVDVQAKAEIHMVLRRLAEQGVALLVSSSEASELLALCDRVLVMARGRIVADLVNEGLTQDDLAFHTGGHQ